jgi:hypothetical protein
MIQRPVKITVCADGHVSIMTIGQHKRLKSAMTVYSANTIPEAIALIEDVCSMKPCYHGGKVGMTVEAWAPNWPPGGTQDVTFIQRLADCFKRAERDRYAPAREAQ